MKKNLTLLALTGTLALGGFLGYELNERSIAQNSVTQNPVTATSPIQNIPTATKSITSATLYDNGKARTESEANTVNVVKERQDGLVYISVTESQTNSPEALLRQRLQRQFGQQFGLPDSQLPEQTGTGSGFFVTSQGDIITNNHVVDGASEITIRLHGSKQTYKAKVIATAPDYDLALIRAEGLPAGKIKPMPLGNSDNLDVGLKAIAMGAPFNLDFSVSEGIISSLERKAEVGSKSISQSVIQTDAAINPGNSGGPLLSSAGEVIGVNTQIATGGIGQSAGVGFAIPVNTVKKLLPQLQAGNGQALQTPSLGVQFTDLSALTETQRQQAKLPASGALLQRIYPGSPAAQAGLQAGNNDALNLNQAANQGGFDSNQQASISTDGDIITAVDGQAIGTGDDLRLAVLDKKIGDSVQLTVQRNGQTRQVTVNLKAFNFPSAQQ